MTELRGGLPFRMIVDESMPEDRIVLANVRFDPPIVRTGVRDGDYVVRVTPQCHLEGDIVAIIDVKP